MASPSVFSKSMPYPESSRGSSLTISVNSFYSLFYCLISKQDHTPPEAFRLRLAKCLLTLV